MSAENRHSVSENIHVNGNAVNTLQAIFENNECKLDVIVCKLEQCFAKFERQQSENSTVTQRALNPIKIIEEMEQIKAELNEVKQLYCDLQSYKKQTYEELRSESQMIQQDINILTSLNK